MAALLPLPLPVPIPVRPTWSDSSTRSFNWYRTSGDSNNKLGTWYDNLQTTVRFQDWEEPLSVPGCWA